MLDRLFALEHTGIKLGLDNISTLCAALGHPERAFVPVHVAGTNGKGSVTAMVHAVLRRAGYRAARYTSPHLSRLNERFVIDDAPVDERTLVSVGASVLDTAEQLVRDGRLEGTPTFFEATTAIGFELFRRARVSVGIIEVGLGGRFDATNVVQSQVGAITSIGLDHEQYLGHTLEAIAFEKAGILKPGMTCVTGDLTPDAAQVIATTAAATGATVIQARDHVSLDADMRDGRARVTIRTADAVYGPLTLGLRGEHQIGNALVAVRVLEVLRTRHGLTIPAAAVEEGLSTVQWPARLERVSWPDGTRHALIDAAHNPQGAAALARYLTRWHPERPPLVIGLMRDKDAEGILEHLLPVTGTVIATAAPTPRAMRADVLAALVQQRSPERMVTSCDRPADALDLAFSHGDTVCVAGSIFLAGAIRDALVARAILR